MWLFRYYIYFEEIKLFLVYKLILKNYVILKNILKIGLNNVYMGENMLLLIK